ncbi:MAG: acyl-CoA dehydrogenase family protein, partial [Verrucomicrobiota bacterium]
MSEEHESTINTAGMSEGKAAALEMTEASRETEWSYATFAGQIFMGRLPWELIYPFPEQPEKDADAGAPFFKKLNDFLESKTDPDTIDREGEIPDDVIKGLAKMGAFGIKIPKAYKGLGLSQTNYCRAAIQLGSYCGNMTAPLSAHQSIGIPQPLIVFGTPEQKKKYLPPLMQGETWGAWGLTEAQAGSDASGTRTTAVRENGHYVVNGSKNFITHAITGNTCVAVAVTDKEKGNKGISAFIFDKSMEGFRSDHKENKLGMRASETASVVFEDCHVPTANLLGNEGEGFLQAMKILDGGRISIA